MKEVCSGIYYTGVQDHELLYFDQLMPLPQGTSYNSYLICGSEKNALIDSAEPRFKEELLNNIQETGVKHIDYIISNHAEQDHSGSFGRLLERYPDAKIVTNEKCKHMLSVEHHLADDVFIIITDGEELSLGDKTLKFIFTPWVHWPETMSTYVKEDKALFTCDLFGAHKAFDDALWVEQEEDVREAAKRYYVEIMMPFAKMVVKNMKKLQEHEISLLAPSHGPIYRDPHIIFDLYSEWTSDHLEGRVVIISVSMHGSTKRMAEHLIWKLKEQGVDAEHYDVMNEEAGHIITRILNAGTLVVCSPTYLGGLHPAIAHFLFLLNSLKPHIAHVGFMGSYGWQENMAHKQLQSFLSHFSGDYIEPLYIEGHPKDEEFQQIDSLVETIKQKHSEF